MKHMKIFICIIMGLVFFAPSCKHKDPLVEKAYGIWVQNNSNVIINYLVSYNYPDTIIPDQYSNLAGIKAMNKGDYQSKKDWDAVFAENNASKISFFFFSPDTITKYGWNDVRSGYKILKRKDLSLQDLKNSNYTVTYP